MSNVPTAPVAPERAEPQGIGGWLILPVIGLVITPIRGILTIPATYSGISGSLGFLTGAQKAFVYAELIFNVVTLLIFPIMLLVLLFQKRRSFVRWYVIWASFSMAGLIIDLILARVLFPESFPTMEALLDEETWRELFRSLILVVLWVPYMLKSRRVANTFVN